MFLPQSFQPHIHVLVIRMEGGLGGFDVKAKVRDNKIETTRCSTRALDGLLSRMGIRGLNGVVNYYFVDN